MKLFGTIIAVLLAVVILVPKDTLTAQDAKKDGKAIFLAAKCNSCHAIESKGIEAVNKKATNPDLSDVGTKLKADFMKKYLKKEEKLNDKKHLMPFKGEDADLDILCAWMETLKTTPEKK